ncbi:glycosyltransferase family 4 protein [Leeuwenhoekiella sp. A2]|uniref:glycosyltransferase family 4 protein n=1 Tax=Leeuwenhoekiella sp. A2 TaxID=3141460 RepID=UPI003A7F8248
MKIVFDPSIGTTNNYVNILVVGFKERGYTVFSLKEVFKNYNDFISVKIVHLNWFENVNSLYEFLNKIAKISLLFLFRKKIVWTLHNKRPHVKNFHLLQEILFKLLIRSADKIVIHSRESRNLLLEINEKVEHKIVHIPHPNYIDSYGVRKHSSLKQSHFLNLLFVGAIKEYKNIELLIEVVNSFNSNDLKLTVAGFCPDQSYAEDIQKLGRNGNVKLDMQYVDDEQLLYYFSKNDLLVLPYDINSSLNSGSAMLAFSYGISVICPEIGTINDIENDNCLFKYNYSSEKEHKDNLKAQIEKAINLKRENSLILKEWGNTLREEVKVKNNQEKIVSSFISLYKSI